MKLAVAGLAVGLAASWAGAPGGAETAARPALDARVLRVHDGDTLKVRLDDGRIERVRMIGIDAPETTRGGRGEIGAEPARNSLEARAGGARVRLVLDPVNVAGDHRDRYGRLLAYVEDGSGRDLGLELLEAGKVRLFRKFKYTRRDAYVAARDRARAAGRGLWGSGSASEWNRMLAAGTRPIEVYPTGGDLWTVCVARRARLEVPSRHLLALLGEIRDLQLAASGPALARRLEAAGFVPVARCVPAGEQARSR